MRFSTAFATLLASTTAVSAFKKGEGFISSLNKKEGHKYANDTRPLVVFLDNDAPDTKNVEALIKDYDLDRNGTGITHFSNKIFKGMIMNNVGHHCRSALSAMTEVSVLEDTVDIESFVTQKQGAPWGLQRISNDAGSSGDPTGQDFTYSFEDEQLGAGVDIYVVDTGIRKSHAVFTGRTQEEEFSFTDSAADGDGHGTHCAGTAAGAKFGVAQGANIFAVKVLGDDGSGSSSDTILGIDWVINNHEKRKQELGDAFVGSIMSMSWGLQGTASTVDQAIMGAIEAGIHISVAAGNDGADACGSTPSHNGGDNSAVVTVGSVNIDNEVSSFSNIGTCVDIYAPGEQILSAWNTGDNIINFLSGTSMACPHTTGVMAYLMAQDKSLGQDPAALKAKLLATARENAFTGNTGGSANLLLSNGVDGGVTARRLMKNYVVPRHGEKRTGGSVASWASSIVNKIDKRWALHSETAQLRY